MTDKQIIIDGVDISKCKQYDEVFNYCDQSYLGEGGLLKNTKNPKRCECSPNCYYKQLKRKEQECEELKEDVERWKSNFNGKVSAIEELLHQLDQLKAENEELRRSITKIFACLIKANRTNKIVDTLWFNGITTLWDYIALTLGIEGDQTQIEEQILQKIS